MKKFIFIFLAIFFSLSMINSLMIILDKDEVDESYIEETYGDSWSVHFTAERMIEMEFTQFQNLTIKAFLEDKDLSDEEKKEMRKKVKAIKFEDKKFMFFSITSQMPFLDSDLKFIITLVNAKGESIVKEIYYFPVKTFIISEHGSGTYYTYYWIIESEKVLTKSNFSKDERPAQLIIEFPNGQKRIYKVKI